jgi:Two component regulator propeller
VKQSVRNAKLRLLRLPRFIYASVLLVSFLSTLTKCENPRADLDASPTGRHQWGVVTLFHGLPSDHVRAIAQDRDGIMWFGTDSGLVKYDGRRIQRITAEGTASARILSLKSDGEGVLWLGTDQGAARLISGDVKPITETHGSTVTAIITPDGGGAMMTTDEGEVFSCTTAPDGSLAIERIGPDDHPLLTIESRRSALRLTSLALINSSLLVGTRSRGVLAIDGTQIKAGSIPPDDFARGRQPASGVLCPRDRGRFWGASLVWRRDLRRRQRSLWRH